MTKNNILDTCLKTLLARANKHIIQFPLSDTLQLADLLDPNIRKNPVPRYIQCIRVENDNILVDIVTPAKDKRCKARINSYTINQFDEQTKGLITHLGIKYVEL